MAKKKSVNKKVSKKKTSRKKNSDAKIDLEKVPTLKLKTEHSIAMDFATKAYKRFDKIIKSIILFGSVTKKDAVAGSDIDIILLIDDVSVSWDQELIAWYREELDKIMKVNPYNSVIHINTIKLSTWWEDLIKGDPVVINVLRHGEAMIDVGGFFNPLKFLLLNGKIKTTPESVYNCLKRAPMHIARSKEAELNSIEGLFWSMVDSAQAALGASNISPPSPEHISVDLKDNFVNSGKLKMKYVLWYRDLLILHKKIMHGQIKDLKGVEIDMWQERAEEFLNVMAQLVKDIVG